MKLRPYAGVPLALLAVITLSGCAGALALLTGALAYLKVRDLVGDVENLISGEPSTTYRVFLDGADMGVSPAANGTLNLVGIPVGSHLFSITSQNMRAGWTQVEVIPASGTPPSFNGINAITGGLIQGEVTRGTTGGGGVAVSGIMVLAVLNGDVTLRTGAITAPPYSLTAPETWMAGFTDANGNYTLGPAAYGRWLVFAARPGYLGDAALVSVQAGTDATNTNLNLQPDSSQSYGTIQGAVADSSGAALANALVDAHLATSYPMALSAATQSKIVTAAGAALSPQPWVLFTDLDATSDVSGQYQITSPGGTQSISAFKYGYKGQVGSASVANGNLVSLDFALPKQ